MIANRILDWARKQPQSLAIVDGDSSIAYFEFARKIEAARRYFSSFDLPKGQFAVVFAQSAIEHWILTLALRQLGLHTVAAPNVEEVAKLGLGNVACVATSGISKPAAPPAGAFKDVRIISVPQKIFARDLIAEPPFEAYAEGPSGGYLLYTSGTTGTFKKLLGGGATEEGVVRWNMQVMSIDRHTIYHMLNFPPWTGIGATATSIWHAGGCLAFSGRTNPYGDFFRHKPTHAMLVPFLLPGILDERRRQEAGLADLELSITGGFLPLSLARRVSKEITPKLDVYYGSTEVCAFMRTRFESEGDLHWLTPVGEIDVVDPNGEICAPGMEGEIRVRLMDYDTDHYLDDPRTTALFFRDGYFFPGDVAVRRTDGRIRVLGRVEDVVNIRGIKFAVAPFEEKIQRVLSVDCACVFSQLNHDGEVEVLIAVESSRRPDDDVLMSAVSGFDGFDRVRWAFLESFPRTERGLAKVDRRKLRDMIG